MEQAHLLLRINPDEMNTAQCAHYRVLNVTLNQCWSWTETAWLILKFGHMLLARDFLVSMHKS